MIRKSLIMFLLFLVNAQLISNSKRSPYFYEITYGEGFNYLKSNTNKIDLTTMNRQVTHNNVDIFGFYAVNGTAEDKLLSYYAFDNAPKPTISGQNSNFLFEYLIKSKFGIGFSLNNSQFQASNLSIPKFYYIVGLNILYPTVPGLQNITRDQFTKLEIALPYINYRNNELANINTFNIHFSYHFLKDSAFDPYVRLLLGLGRDSISTSRIIRSSLSLGSRYFITDQFYLVGEIMGTNYDAYSKMSSLSSKEREILIWTLQEYSAKIGFGFNH